MNEEKVVKCTCNSNDHHCDCGTNCTCDHEITEVVPAISDTSKVNRHNHPVLTKPRPIINRSPKIGRNEPCPCGSKKKFKKCCLLKKGMSN